MNRGVKLTCLLGLCFLVSGISYAQSRTMVIGEVELRLGMARELAVKALTPKYNLEVLREGYSFVVTQYDQTQKRYSVLGSVGFENNQLSFINRSLDTSAWPNDEGFAVARAIYDAINLSVPLTDSDGAKRTGARIVISNQDTSRPRGNMRIIDIYVNDRKITVSMFDGADSKNVSAEVAIRIKPW